LDKVSGLSGKQKDCLRLVAQNLNSKQIARELNISEHTVDQRIRQALRVLAVPDRFQAARLLTAAEGQQPYQPLIHQSEALAEQPDPGLSGASAVRGRRSWIAFWFPPLGGARHDLAASQVLTTIIRLALILAGGCAAVVVMGIWLMSLFA
jgi:DNA-binding CsgD family transcriptional regulator